MDPREKILGKLESIIDDVTNCARQIYYARKCIDEANFAGARTLLGEALRCLGIVSPKDVGLSSCSLGLKNETGNSNIKD